MTSNKSTRRLMNHKISEVNNVQAKVWKVTRIQRKFFFKCHKHKGDRGDTVVNVLCYKSEGRWFDPSWCHWNFSLI